MGTNMTLLALPWFVLTTTGSPGRMGLVMADGCGSGRDPRGLAPV